MKKINGKHILGFLFICLIGFWYALHEIAERNVDTMQIHTDKEEHPINSEDPITVYYLYHFIRMHPNSSSALQSKIYGKVSTEDFTKEYVYNRMLNGGKIKYDPEKKYSFYRYYDWKYRVNENELIKDTVGVNTTIGQSSCGCSN